jgi:purine-cytosine permease-like protein
MVTTFFGYKYIHKTTTTKVVLAMLLPVMLMGLLILAMIIFGTMATEPAG